MAWTGVITNIGKDMLSQWVAGVTLNVTGAAAGSGTVAEAALVNQAALVSQKQEMSIAAGTVVPQGRRIKLQINAPEAGYTLNQIGVWASVGEASPVLLALYQSGDGIVVPSQTEEETFTFTFYAVIATDNTGELNLTIDSEALVTQETMEDYVAEAIADKADLVDGKVPVAQIPDLEYAPKYNAATSYPASAYCVHRGALWVNTSGGTVTGVEPGTDYNKWNVTYSNENLLDNPWFTVNQRGQSEYIGGGGAYTVDRWYLQYANSCFNIDSNRLYSSTTDRQQINQNIDADSISKLSGKIVTLSAIVRSSDFNLYLYERSGWTWVRKRFYDDGTEFKIYSVTGVLTVPENAAGQFSVLSYGAKDVDIVAVKLELGPFSTLANDTAPDYGTELAKCQRYFIKTSCVAVLGKQYNVNSSISVNFPVRMRAIPSTVISGCSVYGFGDIEVSNFIPSWNSESYQIYSITNAADYEGGTAVIYYTASADL